jgi:putative membrane protein
VFEVLTTLSAMAGSHGGAWFLLPVLWIGLAIGLWFLFRGRSGRWQTRPAEEILAERYARGEISVDEYRQRLGVLRGKGA